MYNYIARDLRGLVALVVVGNQGDIAGMLSLSEVRALMEMRIGDWDVVFFKGCLAF